MSLSSAVNIAGVVLATIAAMAFVVAYFRSTTNKDTLQNAKDTIEILNDRIKAQEGKSRQQDQAIYNSEQKISELESEIKVIKTMPLQQLAADYRIVVDTLNKANENLSKVNMILERQENMISFFYGRRDIIMNGHSPIKPKEDKK